MAWWKKLAQKARRAFSPAADQQAGCNHSDIKLRHGTAKFEEFIARAELETKGNLRHGASHLCSLLSFDPGRAESIELLEQYQAAAAPDPESLIPRGEQLYYSTEAMRAYLWHKQGRLADAVELLMSVVEAKPDALYLEAWGLDWLEPAGAVESLAEPLSLRLFASTLGRFPESQLCTLPRLRYVQRWAALCERYWPGREQDGMVTMFRAGLLRKAGKFQEAIALASEALDRDANWHAATALGLALWHAGDVDEAEKAFERAGELDPEDVSARLEAGDMFLERGEWQRSLHWYDEALADHPEHPWAKPSSLYCRWRITDEPRYANDLTELARRDDGRARQLYFRMFGDGLPEPPDATANLVRQLSEELQGEPHADPVCKMQIAVTSLEAPSNYLALQLQMNSLGRDLQLKVLVNHVPKPDPRKPAPGLKHLLWKYDGTDAEPALPQPALDVAERIAALAAEAYDERANWAAASRAAAEIGRARAGEILATMVHPPPMPAGMTALVWIPRIQLAAAQTAAQLDEGWEGSVRREALHSVLLGPSDWATEAAIRALATLGAENEVFAPDIGDAFQQLADRLPDQGYCCWERTLFEHWLRLPHLFDSEREAFAARLREIDSRNDDS